MRKILVTLMFCAMALAAQAMTLVVQGNELFATGPVVEDYVQFVEALAKPGF